jgi:hypothetical protein
MIPKSSRSDATPLGVVVVSTGGQVWMRTGFGLGRSNINNEIRKINYFLRETDGCFSGEVPAFPTLLHV